MCGLSSIEYTSVYCGTAFELRDMLYRNAYTPRSTFVTVAKISFTITAVSTARDHPSLSITCRNTRPSGRFPRRWVALGAL